MQRLVKEVVAARKFDYSAQVHHRYSIGDVPDHG
jgi:hypothetical protein